MIRSTLIILLVIISISIAQEVDSAKVKTAKNAALWSIIPGGGQIYNGKYLKAGIVITLESYAIWKSIENGKNYNNDNSNELLENRNKFAWWAFFIHVFGLLEAVVDQHLEPFNPIMESDSLTINSIEKEIIPNGE